MKIRLNECFGREHILADIQFGSRYSKNTSHALYEISRCITTSFASRKRACATFLYLAKAFDFVDRGKLLCKLYFVGVKNRGHGGGGFKSYLDCRTQTVCVNNAESGSKTISYGVL